MREIRGKWALVTGAASGIGRAIALRLAREGRESVSRRHQRAAADEVVEARARRWASRRSAGVCDVSEPREVSAAVAEVMVAVRRRRYPRQQRRHHLLRQDRAHVGRALGPADAREFAVAHAIHARAAAVDARAARSARAQRVQRAGTRRHAEGDGLLHVEIWHGGIHRIAAQRIRPAKGSA